MSPFLGSIYSHYNAVCQRLGPYFIKMCQNKKQIISNSYKEPRGSFPSSFQKYVKCLLLTSVFIIGLWSTRVYSQERIISLKPNITEILISLGVGDQLIGVTTYCVLPKQKQAMAKVADYVHIDVEKVLTLRPTIVFGSKENSIKKEIEFLKKQGIQVELLPFGRLSSTYSSIQSIASKLGLSGQGRQLVRSMKGSLDQIKSTVSGDPAKILGIVDFKPLVVVGSHNLIADLFKLLGYQNVAGASRLRYPSYSIEKLISSRPELIVDFSKGHSGSKQTKALKWYGQYASIPAVANNRIYFLDIADFLASPRLVEGAKKLVAVVHDGELE